MTTEYNIDSAILNLESLQTEYNLVMIEYRKGYADYIASLNRLDITNTGTNKSFRVINGKKFSGSISISDTIIADAISDKLENCKALCSADIKCIGANFNSSDKKCSILGGDGNIISGTISDNAIIPAITEPLNNLKLLNDRLISLNTQIINALNNIIPDVMNENNKKDQIQNDLINKYADLLIEKKNINDILNQNTSINQNYENKYLYVKQNNLNYVLWSIIALFLIIVTFTLIIYPETKGSDIIKLLFKIMIMIVILFTLTNLNTPTGFLIFGAIIISTLIIFIR